MSKFSWRNGFAVGLVAGISATVFFSVFLETYPTPIPTQDSDADEAHHISPEDNRWWLIWRVAYMEDTLAQWLMTVLTLVAVVLVYLTLRDTRRIALDQSRIGEAQVRAYLTIENARFTILDISGKNNQVACRYDVSVRNSGQSPAFLVGVWIQKDEKSAVGILLPDIAAGQTISRSIDVSKDRDEFTQVEGGVRSDDSIYAQYKTVFEEGGPEQEVWERYQAILPFENNSSVLLEPMLAKKKKYESE